jgi:pimeloyl-ACP methyl ester carboxylesterase
MTATLFPDRVRGVVIAAAASKRYPSHLTENIRRIANPTTSQTDRLALLRETFFAPGNDATVWLDGWHADIRASQLAAHQATTQSEWWAAGGVPLLDLQAADDPFKEASEREELRDELGDRVAIIVIPHASHALLPEQPDAVVAAVCAWADALPASHAR